MSENILTAELFRKMFLAGVSNLEANRSWVDELNVFPVPDGDTGTNMTMTAQSAVDQVAAVTDLNMKNLCKAIAKGSLRGARGNSGVILSQLLRGFTKHAEEFEELELREVILAMEKAVETAYKAVMKPKEGTILTVARSMSEKAAELINDDLEFEEFFKVILNTGDEMLQKTPELLPVLKEAGVVDSGGQGLMIVLHGAYDAYTGKTTVVEPTTRTTPAAQPQEASRGHISTDDIKFGYCTEFIIALTAPASDERLADMQKFLDGIGDSIVFVPDDEMIKIHVHTNEPGNVLQKALTFGELTRIKIDNMREEHRELLGLSGAAQEGVSQAAQPAAPVQDEVGVEPEFNEARKPYGFVAVAAGDGFKEIFESFNVDQIIHGGQTMNPSTKDFMASIDKINAETIFVLPNNSNIIMAAEQTKDNPHGKKIIVIPTKTIPQCLSALIAFDQGSSPEENEEAMCEAIKAVSTLQITYSIRDTQIDDIAIHEGDIMAVGDKKILAAGADKNSVILDGLDKLVNDDSELISIYYGSDSNEDEANELSDILSEKYPDCDIEVNCGGQPVYYYIISVE